MNPNIFEYIKEIKLKTESNSIIWERHSEIPEAFCFRYFTENDQIQVVIDTYKAVFKGDLAQCINFSVVNIHKNIVYHEIVRCGNSDGKFLEEFNELEKLYYICKNNFQTRNLALNQLGIPIGV